MELESPCKILRFLKLSVYSDKCRISRTMFGSGAARINRQGTPINIFRIIASGFTNFIMYTSECGFCKLAAVLLPESDYTHVSRAIHQQLDNNINYEQTLVWRRLPLLLQ